MDLLEAMHTRRIITLLARFRSVDSARAALEAR